MWIFWPFKKSNFGSARNTYVDFNNFIDEHIGRFLIQDEKFLPHPKKAIFEALCVLLYSETDDRLIESVRACAFELAFFQKNVGDAPLHPLGINLDMSDRSIIHADDLTHLKANPIEKEKYDRFKLLRDTEWAKMKSVMAKIPAKSAK